MSVEENFVKVWTDGACKDNQNQTKSVAGVGVYFGEDSPLNLSEPLLGEKQTNQRAELTAIIKALEIIDSDRNVLVITDSKYAMKGLTEWMKNWKKNGWKNAKNKPVENKDLWVKLDNLLETSENEKRRTVKFEWVKGHSKDKGNTEADKLATFGAYMNTIRI